MKKHEVYEGWRFPCGENLSSIEEHDGGKFLEQDYDMAILKEYLIKLPCPCGKGCKPIKCKIIVVNEV